MVCQTSAFNPNISYAIADYHTEEMRLDKDGTAYVYYTGPEQRRAQHSSCFNFSDSRTPASLKKIGGAGVRDYVF